MLSKFIEFNKFNDLLNFKLSECRFSFFFTLVFLFLTKYINLHSNFEYFEEAIKSISLSIAASLIGVIGIILAGVSIIIGVLNKDIKKTIERINSKDALKKVLVSFEFIAFIIGIQILIFFSIYIILHSPQPLINKFAFFVIIALISYLFIFTIFYIISLIGNCIKFFLIATKYEEIAEKDKNIYAVMNELRIDFIFHNLYNNSVSKDKFLENLNKFVDANDIHSKEKIKNYFNGYYSDDD